MFFTVLLDSVIDVYSSAAPCRWRGGVSLQHFQGASDVGLHPTEVQLLPEAELLLPAPLQVSEEDLQGFETRSGDA